ncbi:hypothetical protein T484DRAFT_1744090 [Baffinella frigidus]|nr:hypothetical protein T484DRAFT_1744090 [Cryptophyta sp. CCMP2293]
MLSPSTVDYGAEQLLPGAVDVEHHSSLPPIPTTLAPPEPMELLTSNVPPNVDLKKLLGGSPGAVELSPKRLAPLQTPPAHNSADVSPETLDANGQPGSGRGEEEAWSIGDTTRQASGVLLPVPPAEPPGREWRKSSVSDGALVHVNGGVCGEMAAEEVANKDGASSKVLNLPIVERLENGLTPGEDALRSYNLSLVLIPKPAPHPIAWSRREMG